MNIAQTYHSGLREADDAPVVHHATFAGGIAFVHDIKNGFPKEFEACDVIYAEPPWMVGFKAFNKRAGVDDIKSFEALCGLISNAVMESLKPVFLVCGEAGRKYYPIPDYCERIKLHGAPAVLLVYRAVEVPAADKRLTSEQVVAWLAQRYDRAGDFCCGYGQTGQIFVGAGKQCVLTDYNPHCIGHISIHATNWNRPTA